MINARDEHAAAVDPRVSVGTPPPIPPAGARRRGFVRRHPWLVLMAVAWLVAISAAALLADVLPLARFDTRVLDLPAQAAPRLSWHEPLGTDMFGRSVTARALFGARQSLVIATFSVLFAMCVGLLVGTVSGYFGGRTAKVIAVLTDATLSIPGLVTVLAIASVGRRDIPTVTLAFGVVSLPMVIRLARAQTLAIASRTSVQAARALGASHGRILARELLPDVLLKISPLAFILAGNVIVGSASLSFLGLGIPPPSPSWGSMINDGRKFLEESPHLVFVPSAFIFLTVSSFTVIGDHIRNRVDGGGR